VVPAGCSSIFRRLLTENALARRPESISFNSLKLNHLSGDNHV
jgi:hypothetical protein